MVFTRFFDPETQSFAQDPCVMVVALPSTSLDGPALALMPDDVWGDDKLLHLLGLPVTDTVDDPISPVCGTMGTECLSGIYPTHIRDAIIKMPLVWCMNWDVAFSVSSAPHKTLVDNKIMG
jgi:hypothetical protein